MGNFCFLLLCIGFFLPPRCRLFHPEVVGWGCKHQSIKELSSIDTTGFTDIEKLQTERDIQVEELRRKRLRSDLSELGYKDGRGRPKKADSEKYFSSRNKFTAMLLSENLNYLKKLKESKKIKNISAFLDELIENYRGWNNPS